MPRAIMMFPGMMFPEQGARYYQMGRELYRENPVFRQAVDRCDAIARGFDVADTVDEGAPDVAAWRRGDRVTGMLLFGGYANSAALPAAWAVAMPPALEVAAAGGFPVAYRTAYGACTRHARLRPGERVLVFGAAGGVGLASVAVARVLGGEVVAVAAARDDRLAAPSRLRMVPRI